MSAFIFYQHFPWHCWINVPEFRGWTTTLISYLCVPSCVSIIMFTTFKCQPFWNPNPILGSSLKRIKHTYESWSVKLWLFEAKVVDFVWIMSSATVLSRSLCWLFFVLDIRDYSSKRQDCDLNIEFYHLYLNKTQNEKQNFQVILWQYIRKA